MDDWVEKRKGKISASNVAAILGLKPFGKTPIDAWQQIMGYAPPAPDKPAFRMGRKVESVIAELYAEEAGVELVTLKDPMIHPLLPWLCGTPDRLILGQPKGLEIKNVGQHMARGWGEPGTDEIPDYYLTQVAIYMAITGYDAFDVVASLAGAYPVVYPVCRDEELENKILKALDEWYVLHIAGNTPPEPDGTSNYTEYLKHRWPRNEKPLRTADPMIELAMANLDEARRDCNEAEERKALYENTIKAYIGDADGVQGGCGSITWKAAKDSKKVDYEGITSLLFKLSGVQEVLQKHELTSSIIVSDYTLIIPGSRRFLTKFFDKLKVGG